MTGLVLLALALVGCGGSVDCPDAEAVLAEAGGRTLSCGEAGDAVDYLELLAGRPLLTGDRPTVLRDVRDRFEAAPAETLAWLAEMRAAGAVLAAQRGLEGAEARATRVWEADHGEGLVTPAHGAVWKAQKRALGVWTKDDETHLAVTESDLEAWIRYASLCREVQGGTVLRISVADRVGVYQTLIDRFDEGDRQAQIALASLGPVWPAVKDRWQTATFEEQQGWIQAAPLPPPMTATSLAYAEAVFQADVWAHARVLQEQLGPFRVGALDRFRDADEAAPEAPAPEVPAPEAPAPPAPPAPPEGQPG